MAGDSSVSILRSSFERCLSQEDGGAIQAKNFVNLSIVDTNFTSNKGEFGSDITASDAPNPLSIQNCRFTRSQTNPITIFNSGIQIISSSFT